MTNAAIHRVSRDVVGFVRSVTGDQWIAAGLRPRDDKSVAFPFTLHSSIFTLPSLAFLETDTEAKGIVAVARGVAAVALGGT